LLEVKDLQVEYGKIKAIWGVSFHVNQGETVSIIGPNGAGKTTILKTVAGILKPTVGRITFRRRDIGGMPAHDVANQGLALVPEGREIFPYMSVYENLLLGARLQRNKERVKATLEWLYTIFPLLKERKGQLASTLSGGEQQMLVIARALMPHPHLLMLDEPSTGLSPLVVERIFEVIKKLSEQGTTTLLVEQNVHLALEISDRAYVLERGKVILEGDAKRLLDNPLVREAYIGLPASSTF
jgi:branched-chain amino acid transport system ATP-binding protein